MSKKVVIEIDLGNAAFEDEPAFEVARILGEVTMKLELGHIVIPGYEVGLTDINGNHVGSIKTVGK
jgi:hypothetical protein